MAYMEDFEIVAAMSGSERRSRPTGPMTRVHAVRLARVFVA